MYSKAEAIEIINKGSDDMKFVVRTNAEDELFQATRENLLIKNKVGQIHSQYDEDIIGATGIEKESGEKTYNYNKRVLLHLKSKADESGDDKLKLQITDLKEKLENKDDDVTKKEIVGLKAALKSAQDELKSTVTSKDTELNSLVVKNVVENALAGLKFKSDIPEEAINALTKSVVEKITESGQKTDSGVAFFNGEEILLDKKTGEPQKATDILSAELDSILDKGKNQEGSGGKKSVNKGADGSEVMPSTVSSLDGLTNWLAEIGHSHGSREYQVLYDKYREQIT